MTKSLALIGGGLGLMLNIGCAAAPSSTRLTLGPSEIYSGYKQDASRGGYVVSARADTLEKRWQIKFRHPLFLAPSFAKNYLFQPSADKRIHVIDVNSGTIVAEIKSRRPLGSTPEVAGCFLVICEEGAKGELVVFDYCQGKPVWTAKTFGLCAQPVIGNGTVYWVDGRGGVNASELSTGRVKWSRLPGAKFDVGPVVHRGKVVVTGADSSLYCLDATSGAILWRVKTKGRTNSSPACFDDAIYVCHANGLVACYDTKDGGLLWEHQDRPRLFFSPAVDSQAVYYGTGDGRLVCLDRHDGQLQWQFEAASPIRGTALVTPTTVIFGSLDFMVYMVDKQTGNARFSFKTKGMISAAPTITNERLFIAAQDKYLYCFLISAEETSER